MARRLMGKDVCAVIMAGGAGTRFWPLSTESNPKQFLRPSGGESLLEQSYSRAEALTSADRILVLTSERLADRVARELPELPQDNIIAEPARRDTAAAVALGALVCRVRFGEAVMVVVTADHVIAPLAGFLRVMEFAVRHAAESGALYTVGIEPDRAATEFGYLKRGDLVATEDHLEHFRVDSFREKPDPETAEGYLEAGGYFWNSGMFVWEVASILEEYRRQLPGHLTALEPAVKRTDEGASSGWRQAFLGLPSISIDHGVMEGARDVRMVPADFSWSDLGSWEALARFLNRDEHGNRYRGHLNVKEAQKNIVFTEDEEESIALIGVEGLVVVRAGGRTLVMDRERAEELKEFVRRLRETEGKEPR